MTTFAPGSLVRARGREWVVLPHQDPRIVLLRPLAGTSDEVTGILRGIEPIEAATFDPPTLADLGDATGARLLHTALRVGFRSGAGPFRGLASVSVTPRPYQLVPLLMALRQDPVRLLIADDVGVGKTVEAGLIATELLAQGDTQRLGVFCPPHLAEQWQAELREKFGVHARLVLASTIRQLERACPHGVSFFQHYPHVIVSTELAKNPAKRAEFLRDFPELVIVDEAHTCVAESASRGAAAHQRYELVTELAADPNRHLLLVTATPHSGKEGAFRSLIGLLSPALAALPDRLGEADRRLLAQHLVQRRREDIRAYLDDTTPFPERENIDAPYGLSPAYRRLFDRVLRLARETVRDAEGNTVAHRIRWWSALALLQAMASSPAAAAATLRTRAANATAETPEDADAIGQAIVLDLDADTEARDTPAGASDEEDRANAAPSGGSTLGRRLRELARDLDRLPAVEDAKLGVLTARLKALLADGYHPIVFCRFIQTSEYVAAHLAAALGRGTAVIAVTGQLPPGEREQRIQDLTTSEARHRVLVTTDCLSEGVNLQESFDAVVHYDLAWNPTRHEQREGRVDRFGQRRDQVRVVTVRGTDNRVDELVLSVLLRKHQAIRTATGVSVPVPGDAGTVLGVVAEQLLLTSDEPEQLALDVAVDTRRADLHRRWEQAAAAEQTARRTRFAQATIRPDQVAAEVGAVRASLGDPNEVAAFARSALAALGGAVTPLPDGGFTVTIGDLPPALLDQLPPTRTDRLTFRTDVPTPPGEAALVRTDPTVEGLARYVLDSALDPAVPPHRRPARRAGAIATTAVDRRTVLLLVRHRFQLAIPVRDGTRPLVAEDAELVAYRSTPDGPVWLPDEQTAALAAATPDANLAVNQVERSVTRALEDLPSLADSLAERARQRAGALAAAHRRVRETAGARLRGLTVTPQLPPDVLGVYILLPAPPIAGGTR